MTLDSSSSPGAVAPVAQPHEQSWPTETADGDEGERTLAALLADPSAMSSEESGPAGFTAASPGAAASPAQPASSADPLPDEPPPAGSHAAPAHADDDSAAVGTAAVDGHDTRTAAAPDPPAAPAEEDALPAVIALPAPADWPAADAGDGANDASLRDADQADVVSLPDQSGAAVTESESDFHDTLLRDIVGAPSVSSDHGDVAGDAAWLAERNALLRKAVDVLSEGGMGAVAVPPDEAAAPASAPDDERLDDIDGTQPTSSERAAAPAGVASPEANREVPQGTSVAPRAADASALDGTAPEHAEDALGAPSDEAAAQAGSSDSSDRGAAAATAPAWDDALLRDIDDAHSVSSDQLVLPTPAVASAFDEAILSDINVVADPPAPVADPAFDEAILSDIDGVADPPEVPGDPAGADYGDLPLGAVPPGPAAALAFATDPDTELALRDGLSGYESFSPDCGDPQVWHGGLRAAIAALSDGHSARLIFVDVDGIPFPAGAIHELAAVCEVGTIVVAIGSDDTARPGRELLLAGVADYLAKPLTAEAVRAVAARATPDSADGRPAGCVAGFIGSGGSGTTTLMTAAALQAAARGCYVSVLDLNRSVAAAALSLGVEPAAGLDQLLEAAGRATPDPEMVEGVCIRRSDRIELYAHRWSPTPPPAASPVAVDSLLAALRLRSHLVLVDGLDEPGLCFSPPVEVDRQIFVAEPTVGKAVHAARMIELLGADPPPLFVQNHTRAFKRGAGARVLRDAGIEIEPDVVIPFEPSLPEASDWGWPKGRLPRSLRKPVTVLTDRLLEPSPGGGVAASDHLPRGS